MGGVAFGSSLPVSQRGATNGVASLVGGKVPVTQLPAATALAAGTESVAHYLAVESVIENSDELSSAPVPAFVAGAASIAPGTDKVSRYYLAADRTLAVPSTLTILTTDMPTGLNVLIVCMSPTLGNTLTISNGTDTLGAFTSPLAVPLIISVYYDGSKIVSTGIWFAKARS